MKLGRYELKKRIAIGGMGEIYLAHDTMVHRDIALKKIKAEKSERKYMKRRFLREAMLTARLTHPSIIPIYSVHQEGDLIYYTMPFIEGKSMKSLIKERAHEESLPRARSGSGASIPNMTRHFLSVCHAIDYAHSQSILHRDLKPDNIMIGKFGEVYLLDWGIAGYADEELRDNDPVGDLISHLTLPGAIPGTLPFMAPELAMGKMPTVQSEIFALGVLLYLILTLDIPFHRTTIDDFKKTFRFEKLIPPEEHAPHRDIPRQLSLMAQKCLAFHPADRYQTAHELIEDLENYIEGKPDWINAKALDIHKLDDWEFQENVLLTKHMAITRVIEEMEWVVLMLSKEGFAGNVRLKAKARLHDKCHGIGFLISVPEPWERKGLEDGYTLWLGSSIDKGCILFRNNAEVISMPNLFLEADQDYIITIERVDTTLRMYINGSLELNYNSLVPMTGTHIGMIYRDGDFELEPIAIETGSQNVMVKCLSIPDAFLANKDYEKAFTEYKRIASSFKGRSEEREALFRAGISKIEEGKHSEERETFFAQAREQFERLRSTPGAPMEYLGKSLIYIEEGEIEEEIKCLELAIRKYPHHPHLAKIEEHIIFRLHETSQKDRIGAYRFA
ncbi:MAG: protein kinase, partial [Simkaniaceae bacterium]|nr:protein kinase [Simkaniaceae bacterium]